MRTVLFLGDSLTEWNDWQARFPECRVVNLGLSGETAGGLLSRLPSIVSRFPAADAAFVMTGINNLAMGYADFLGEYRRIVDSLKEAYPEAVIYVQAVLPVAADWIDLDTIIEVNGRLEDMCRTAGVRFLDTFTLFLDKRGRVRRDLFDADGVHVGPAGYRVWEGFLSSVVGG